MNMEWVKLHPKNLPAQGMKILCFKKGDVWVARRFNYKNKDYWVEFIYGGIGSVLTDKPDYWMKLELVEGYTGYMFIGLDDQELVTFDEFQKIDPKSHEEFVGLIIEKSQRKNKNGMD